jgi:hypothetical protein
MHESAKVCPNLTEPKISGGIPNRTPPKHGSVMSVGCASSYPGKVKLGHAPNSYMRQWCPIIRWVGQIITNKIPGVRRIATVTVRPLRNQLKQKIWGLKYYYLQYDKGLIVTMLDSTGLNVTVSKWGSD